MFLFFLTSTRTRQESPTDCFGAEAVAPIQSTALRFLGNPVSKQRWLGAETNSDFPAGCPHSLALSLNAKESTELQQPRAARSEPLAEQHRSVAVLAC